MSKNVPSDYNTTTRTCSNVYCHSTGNPRGVGMAWKSSETPSWENGKNKILGLATECTTCHESGSTLTTNAHYTHVTTNSFKCMVCHADTVNASGGIASRVKHANGTKDVVFVTRPESYQSVFSGSFDSGAATCTNSCHTNGLNGGAPARTALWTEAPVNKGAAYCGSCHAAVPATSLHTKHFTDPAGPQLGTAPTVCANCHDYASGAATHANGVVNLKSGNSCAPCHPAAAPVWAVGAKVSCESCHTGSPTSVVGSATAPAKNLNDSVGHGQYSSASLHVKCTTCHNGSAPHIGAGPTEKRLVVAGNALCNTCHIPSIMGNQSTARANLPAHGGTVNNFSRFTSALNLANIATVRSDACAGCHDTHGTTNLMSIKATINGQSIVFTNTSTGFYVTNPNGNGIYNGLCQVCHTKTNHYRNNAPIDGPIGHYTRDCLTCHKHKGTTFAFSGAGGSCGGCHGYPPVRDMAGLGTTNNYANAKLQDYSGGGGAHTVAGHIPRNAVESATMTNCTNCHNTNFATEHNKGSMPVKKGFVIVKVDPQFKFNNATSITYNAQTCSNVSCHFKPSPNWTNGL